MMAKMRPFLLGSLCGAALIYVGLQYHVVRSSKGFYLVPRMPQAPLGLAYADVRNMRPEEWRSRPELARAMAAHNAREVLKTQREQAAAAAAAREGYDPGNDLPDLFDRQRDGEGSAAPIWNPFRRNERRSEEQVSGETPFREITDKRVDPDRSSADLRPTFDLTVSGREARASDSVPRPDNGMLPPGSRSSTTRRAREIYEQSRARVSESFDDPLQRQKSRASSLIDELLGPGQQQTRDMIDRGGDAHSAGRYMRSGGR